MSLTDQELDQFLNEVGVFSEEKLESLVEVREKPEVPKPPESKKTKPLLFFSIVGIAFILGLSIGLATKNFTTSKQFTYIVQKLNELENSKDLIEPLEEFHPVR